MKAIIYILAGVAALIAGAVSAQAPETCAAEDRVVPGNLLSPCKQPFVIDIESMEYRFEQILAAPPAPLSKSYCVSYMVFHVGDGWVSPSAEGVVNEISLWGDGVPDFGLWHHSLEFDWHGIEDWETKEILVPLEWRDLEGGTRRMPNFGAYDHSPKWLYYDRDGEAPWEIRLSFATRYQWQSGTSIHHGGQHRDAHLLLDADGFYDYQSNLDKCVGLLHLEYQRVENEENLRRQKVEAENQAAVEEQASLNNIALQKAVLRVEGQINALRVAVAARINDNVAELALVREQTVQAAIEADREITALQIEAKRREYESLEKTSQWLASWAQEKRDDWDDFLSTAEETWQTKIQEHQAATAAALAELESKKASVEQDIAESVRLQSQLQIQLQAKDADLAALQTQLDDARAALEAAEAKLAEAQAVDN